MVPRRGGAGGQDTNTLRRRRRYHIAATAAVIIVVIISTETTAIPSRRCQQVRASDGLVGGRVVCMIAKCPRRCRGIITTRQVMSATNNPPTDGTL